MSMRFFIRADASAQIGTGHVMRCLTLSDALASHGYQCVFITRAHSGHLAELIERRGHRVELLPVVEQSHRGNTANIAYQHWLGADWEQDADQTIAVMQGERPAWLIVDHYAIDARWHKVLRPAVDKIFVIDDLADNRLDCDLLLNQNFGHTESDYKHLIDSPCRMMIGPRYALLRPEFADLRFKALAKRRKYLGIRRILVSMGGSDPHNVTAKVLRCLAEIDWPIQPTVDVVLNSRAPHLEEVVEQAKRYALNVSVCTDVDDMALRMLEADLAIGAGGATNWERCSLGLPALIISTAANQDDMATMMHQKGVIVHVGTVAELGEDYIADGVGLASQADKWFSLSRNSAVLTSGLGVQLIIKRLFETL